VTRHVYGQPDGDVDRLPKWAQTYIRELKGEKARLEEKLAERDAYIAEQHPDSNVTLNRGIDYERPLPRNAHVSFNFGGDWDNAIEVRHADEKWRPSQLYVTGLRGSIAVYPQSGNAFYIGSVER
jgi:hypothetical protein